MQTLGEFIIEKQKDFSEASGELSKLLSSIKLATKIVNREVSKAGITNILGAVNQMNVQGEQQQKLDVFANDHFIKALTARGVVCGIASEENDDFIICNPTENSGKYVVAIDPLDGSSNIDVNVSIGTIFSIYKRKSQLGTPVVLDDFLQKGTDQIAAGYVLYGSSSMLVYTTGNGVNGFTIDPSIGTVYLSHPDMKIPSQGYIYSVNEGHYNSFSEGIKKYIDYCKDTTDKKPYSARYIGSLVADFHRNLIKGGIYMYPSTKSAPNGKLRLLYECNPLAFIIEQAGGKATNGKRRILEIEPKELHQRTPILIGSKQMVEKAEALISTT